MQAIPRTSAYIEKAQRLSRSLVWQLQREFFERKGIEAWSTNTVPHHITSAPFIADAYAKVGLGYLRDCLVGTTPLELSEPVYFIECGSGPGRFAYVFLKKFQAYQRDSHLKTIPFKYVITDFSEKNVEYCRSHAWLQPFIEAGVLDFARFDVERDQKLRLLVSGEVLAVRKLRNPIVVIANYLFDSIPQDAFAIVDHRLFENLITLETPEGESDPNDPDILSRVQVSYDLNPVSGNYYKDKKWNRILRDYSERFSRMAFLFPSAALQCIQNLHRLAGGRMLLLSGDRGHSNDDALRAGKGAPNMSVHGSFSMNVDYQIIGEYCRLLSGQVLHPGRQSESLNVSAFVFGDSDTNFAETRFAYGDAIEKFGPDDFFTLKEGIAQVYDALSLDQILAFLRLSCWDYKRFWECLPALKEHVADMTEIQKQKLREAILKVWDSYLPIGEENDLAFELGTLLLELEFHADAIDFLKRSVDLYGIAPGTAYNIGVCYHYLEQLEAALTHLNHALDLDPAFVEAKALRAALLARQHRRPVRRQRQSAAID